MPNDFLRNPKESPVLDYRNSDFQRLLYQALIIEKKIGLLDLAEHLNKRADTLYAYAEGELRLHLDEAKKISRFALTVDPDYTAFAKLFLTEKHAIIRVDDKVQAETLVVINRMVNDLISKKGR